SKSPLCLDRPLAAATRARLADAGRTRLELENLRRLDVRDRSLAAGAEAVLALGIGQPHVAVAHAGRAADDDVKADQPPRALVRLEALQLDLGVDVLAPRSRMPLVDALIAAPAVGVSVVEGAGLAPREHGV